MNITLQAFELVIASSVGARRYIQSIKLDKSKTGDEAMSWQSDIEAACAEMVVAKYLNVYWDGSVGTFKSVPDVGDVEVRHTPVHSNKLIVRDRDSDDGIYYLVTGEAPYFTVRGWIRGADAKQERWKRDPNNRGLPAYFVPQRELNGASHGD